MESRSEKRGCIWLVAIVVIQHLHTVDTATKSSFLANAALRRTLSFNPATCPFASNCLSHSDRSRSWYLVSGPNGEQETLSSMMFLNRFQSHASPLCRHLMRAFSIESGAWLACARRSGGSPLLPPGTTSLDHLPILNTLPLYPGSLSGRRCPALSAQGFVWYWANPSVSPRLLRTMTGSRLYVPQSLCWFVHHRSGAI